MSDYISREELKRTLKPFVIKKGVMENINAIPSADVRENIHGEWIEFSDGRCTCSKCNFYLGAFSFFNFCPDCGEDMRPEPYKAEKGGE